MLLIMIIYVHMYLHWRVDNDHDRMNHFQFSSFKWLTDYHHPPQSTQYMFIIFVIICTVFHFIIIISSFYQMKNKIKMKYGSKENYIWYGVSYRLTPITKPKRQPMKKCGGFGIRDIDVMLCNLHVGCFCSWIVPRIYENAFLLLQLFLWS